ncbi:lipopolysaccharide biosynthesis protein [Catellatospora sichuanensis]|uniref:lipopolysaccharide biosynthesis protein n=1 Tax=Catellatospora sichuanensis TaxID=1969805 RepID=UPI00164281EA|nr:lipopolysaccharide biosynthesis protein [Catellatospora sichuanensis]
MTADRTETAAPGFTATGAPSGSAHRDSAMDETAELPVTMRVPTVRDGQATETAEPSSPAVEPPAGRLPRGAVLWSYVLTIGRFGTTAGVTIVMAKFLEPADYGLVALAMVWVTFAQSLSLHGTVQAIVQREEVDDSHFDAAFWTTAGTGVALAAVFAIAVPLWAGLNQTPDLIPICLALAPVMVLNATVVVPDAILRRQLKFRSLSVRWLLAGLVSGVVGIVGAIIGWGVWALVAQQLVMTTFSAVAVWIAVQWRPRFRRIGPALRELRQYSLHSLSGFFAYFVAMRTDALLLGPLFGPTAIGLYRFITRIPEMLNDVATGGLAQVAMPHLSRAAPSREEFDRYAARYIHTGTLIAYPALGVLFAVGPLFLQWIGPQWTPAGSAFQVLCVAMAAVALGPLMGAIYQAAGRPDTLAAINWASAAATVAGMLVAGALFHDADPGTQVLAIATTFAILQWVTTIVALALMFSQVMIRSMAAGLRPSLPAAVAAVAAGAAGPAVRPLLHGTNATVGLIVTGVVAAAAGLAVLTATEREVSTRVARIVRGRR